uniref:Uncharacterized protein n=1 Tax=Vespula pensylvanica TaxID=30213 RepID=A0A834P9S2_VESPE|nr:hypothetical protein H0235_005189 [Vespula pensylvanica]
MPRYSKIETTASVGTCGGSSDPSGGASRAFSAGTDGLKLDSWPVPRKQPIGDSSAFSSKRRNTGVDKERIEEEEEGEKGTYFEAIRNKRMKDIEREEDSPLEYPSVEAMWVTDGQEETFYRPRPTIKNDKKG